MNLDHSLLMISTRFGAEGKGEAGVQWVDRRIKGSD